MKKLSFFLSGILFFVSGFSQVAVTHIKCEDLINPIGIGLANPRFSWQLSSSVRNTKQTAYELEVMDQMTHTIVWNSGKKMTDQSVFVPYSGSDLKSGARYEWRIRVWDNQGRASDWSAKSFWQMGLLKPEDWKSKWIESASSADSVNGPAQLFRKPFSAGKEIRLATIFITVHGMYEAFLNGRKIGDAVLSPGWTSYNKRLQYQAYDVTSLMKKGKNALGVAIGSGWYRTPLAWNNNKNIYGKKLGLLAQLEIIYSDGSRETIRTDNSWKTSDAGPVRVSEIYDGELYDSRMEQKGWNTIDFNEKDWKIVSEKDFPKDNLVATYNEPVRKHEIFHALRVFKTPRGEQVVDFGQNLVGWAQLKIQGKSGDSVVVDHAEVLDKEGNFYTDNLRAAKARNIYILNGNGEEIFEPHFTFQGFRYIRISGFAGKINPTDITAVALYSDMQPTGIFECSNPMLNQLQHNIQWGQKGNFLDVPTDCPQRDERLGWTGDAQAFSRTACFNMGVHNFFSKWLKDLTADQSNDGRVPFVIPNVLGPLDGGSAGWSDVSTIIPWNMWLAYGDPKILADQYESMKAWVGFMESHSNHFLWNTGFHFGDWLFYRPADDNDGRSAVTDKYLIAQCFFAHSTQLLLNAAGVLQKADDVKRYTELLKQIKHAFLNEYLTPSGRLVSSTQTAYVLALQFDMLPEEQRAQAAGRLVNNVEDYGNHLTTGFLGTPYLCHVLSRFGYDTVAYKLLLQETYPSWLYPVKMGATTIWERWDGQKPDSSFQTPGMNSFNHYAYGAIGDWMYRVITGLDTDKDSVGYKKILVRPHPGGHLTYANSDLETGYGKLSAHWKLTDGKFILDINIPPNTSATIYIPTRDKESLTENEQPLSKQKDIKIMGQDGNYFVVTTGSGAYHFSTDYQ